MGRRKLFGADEAQKIYIMLSANKLGMIDQLAFEEGKSRAAIVREAVDRYLANFKPRDKQPQKPKLGAIITNVDDLVLPGTIIGRFKV